MPKKIVCVLLALLWIALTATACSKDDGGGRNLYYPIDAEPLGLDPQIVGDKPSRIAVTNCLEGLVRIDEEGKPVPGVAKSWDISDDGLVYSFTLRGDARWHMTKTMAKILGEDYETNFDDRITAADFVFALRRALLPATNAPDAPALFAIENAEKVHQGKLPPEKLGITAANDLTLIITLQRANPEFLLTLADAVGMPCSETFFNATKGKYGLDVEYVLCNGPFFLSKWSHDSSLILRKNEEYNGPLAVYPQSVTLTINPDSASRLNKLEQGTYTAAELDAKTAVSAGSMGLTLIERKNMTQSILFNCSDATLRYTGVRLALCGAVEPGELGFDIAGGEMTSCLVPLCCMVGDASFRSVKPQCDGIEPDITKAKRLLEEELNKRGGKQFVFTLLCAAEHENAMRRLLQLWQQAFGIRLIVTIECLDGVELADRVSRGNYQIAMVPVEAAESSAAGFLSRFSSMSASNPAFYSSENYDAIMQKLNTVGTARDLADGCLKAEEHLLQNGVVYPLFTRSRYLAFAENAEGIYLYPAGENTLLSSAKYFD